MMLRLLMLRLTATLGLIALLSGCASVHSEESFHARNMTAYRSFVDELPSLDTTEVEQPRVIRDGRLWLGYGGGRPKPLDLLFVTGVFDAPPLDWAEEYKKSNDSGALATCYRGKPAIFYDPSFLNRLTPYSFPFVREHERAHFAEGHINCDEEDRKLRYPDPLPGEERKADCMAATWLEESRYGLNSRLLRGAAAESLYHLPASSHHPPGRVRADYVMRSCT